MKKFFFVYLPISLIRSLITAFVAVCLWAWFIVPFGVPQISLAHAYGFDLFVSWLVTTDLDLNALIVSDKLTTNVPAYHKVAFAMIFNLVVLITGYGVHILMLMGY